MTFNKEIVRCLLFCFFITGSVTIFILRSNLTRGLFDDSHHISLSPPAQTKTLSVFSFVGHPVYLEVFRVSSRSCITVRPPVDVTQAIENGQNVNTHMPDLAGQSAARQLHAGSIKLQPSLICILSLPAMTRHVCGCELPLNATLGPPRYIRMVNN